jgi:hypothetical protein
MINKITVSGRKTRMFRPMWGNWQSLVIQLVLWWISQAVQNVYSLRMPIRLLWISLRWTETSMNRYLDWWFKWLGMGNEFSKRDCRYWMSERLSVCCDGWCWKFAFCSHGDLLSKFAIWIKLLPWYGKMNIQQNELPCPVCATVIGKLIPRSIWLRVIFIFHF